MKMTVNHNRQLQFRVIIFYSTLRVATLEFQNFQGSKLVQKEVWFYATQKRFVLSILYSMISVTEKHRDFIRVSAQGSIRHILWLCYIPSLLYVIKILSLPVGSVIVLACCYPFIDRSHMRRNTGKK